MQERCQAIARIESWFQHVAEIFDDYRMLGYREGVAALCLAIPAGHTSEAMGNVLDLDIHGRGMGKVEPTSRQHALPDSRWFNRTLRWGAHPGHL
jgi:hypothetical protein